MTRCKNIVIDFVALIVVVAVAVAVADVVVVVVVVVFVVDVVVFAVVVVVHLEGPASCICSSKWNGLLQMTIRRGWALASDHPSPMLGSRFNLTDLSRKIFVDIFDSQSNIN